MKHTVLNQLENFGVGASLRHNTSAAYRRMYDVPVHEWEVLVFSREGGDTMEDTYQLTSMEYRAFGSDTVKLTQAYFKSLATRMDRVRSLGRKREFTAWCKLQGFEPKTLASLQNTERWRAKFNTDCRCFHEFADVLGGYDRLDEFLDTTIR